MMNYEHMIYNMLPGETPRQKYEKLKEFIEAAERIAYPRRGTPDFTMDVYEAAELLQKVIPNPQMKL